MEQIKECPRCGCPHWEASTSDTGGQKRSRQDKDGEWYIGPEEQTVIYRCHHCGWNYSVSKRWGKIDTTTLGPAVLALLKDWDPEKAFDKLLRHIPGAELQQLKLERYKGYLEVTHRVSLITPQKEESPPTEG